MTSDSENMIYLGNLVIERNSIRSSGAGSGGSVRSGGLYFTGSMTRILSEHIVATGNIASGIGASTVRVGIEIFSSLSH